MFERVKQKLRETKQTAQDYTKQFIEMLGGLLTVCASALLFFHAEWQINIQTQDYVWNSFPDLLSKIHYWMSQGYTSMRYVPFQDGKFFVMQFGNANDVFFALMALGWFLGIIGTFLLVHGTMSIISKKTLKKEHVRWIMDEN
jgi:Ca2+/Na+ antiporter